MGPWQRLRVPKSGAGRDLGSPPGCHESEEACQGNGRASDAPGSLITPFMTGYSGGPLGSPMGARERERERAKRVRNGQSCIRNCPEVKRSPETVERAEE